MADSTLNRFVASGDTAARTAFTPSAPTPASGPDPGYLWWDTDTQTEWAYDFGLADWVELSSGGGGGNVNAGGTLTANAVVIGAGSTDVDVLASLGTAGQVLQSAGAGSPPAFASPDYAFIEEQTPTGTNVAFSSLGAFTNLQIRYSARGDTVATSTPLLLRFNGDTGANYDRQFLAGAASVASALESLGQTSAEVSAIAAASASAGMPSTGTIEIYDYRGTTFQKNVIASMNLRRSSASGNVFARVYSVGWLSTAAITSITLTLTAGNFVAGSKFTLYGLR